MDVEDIGKFRQRFMAANTSIPCLSPYSPAYARVNYWEDCVDFENGLLLINKQHNRVKGDTEFRFASLKNGKALVLTVADEVMEVLKLQKRRQEVWAATLGDGWSNPDNLVFTTEFDRYINNKVLYQNFKRIMKKLGNPNLRIHDLRHTYAVNSLRARDDIKIVQENLGHATASFTLATYTHATTRHEAGEYQENDRVHPFGAGCLAAESDHKDSLVVVTVVVKRNSPLKHLTFQRRKAHILPKSKRNSAPKLVRSWWGKVDSMACFARQSNKEETSLRTGLLGRPLACWI